MCMQKFDNILPPLVRGEGFEALVPQARGVAGSKMRRIIDAPSRNQNIPTCTYQYKYNAIVCVSVCMSVCMCVCLSVSFRAPPLQRTIFLTYQ